MKDLNKRVSAMLLKTLIKPKKELTTVKEDCTLEEALHVLEDSGYRCVPILDESGKFSAATSTRCTSIVTNRAAVT